MIPLLKVHQLAETHYLTVAGRLTCSPPLINSHPSLNRDYLGDQWADAFYVDWLLVLQAKQFNENRS